MQLLFLLVPALFFFPELEVPAKNALRESGSSTSFLRSQKVESTISWIEMGSESSILARVITQEAHCPELTLDGKIAPMRTRVEASKPNFPVLVCELNIPPGTSRASLEGHSLPLPKSHPTRIAIFGDTGCRVKNSANESQIQDCHDPTKWPFKSIAEQMARWHPDLVIHLGDYLYREAPCPEGDSRCADSPYGDKWETWNADFFSPAASLLRTSPWVMVRGNHENCTRSGEGWFRFLDPQLYSAICEDFSPPYSVDVGHVGLDILDSTAASDATPSDSQALKYALQTSILANSALARPSGPRSRWLLTHKPFWGAVRVQSPTELLHSNVALDSSWQLNAPTRFQSIFSGHIHQFEILTFSSTRPPQWVVGTGGTDMDQSLPANLDGFLLHGAKVKMGRSVNQSGYLTLERQSNGDWQVTQRDVKGNALLRCVMHGSEIQC